VIVVPFWFVVFTLEVAVLKPSEVTHLSDRNAALLFTALGAVSVLVSWFYETVTTTSRMGGTVGKRVLGMRVVNVDGSRLTGLRCFVRAVAKTFSIAAVGEGLLYLPFTPNRQALHDTLADSVVLVGARSGSTRPLNPAPPVAMYRKVILVLFTGSTAAVVIGWFAANTPVMIAGAIVFLGVGLFGWLTRSNSVLAGSKALEAAARPYLGAESTVLIAMCERRLWSTGSSVAMAILLGWISVVIRTFAAQRLIVALTPSRLTLIQLDRSGRATGLLATYQRSMISVLPGRSWFGTRQLTVKAPDQEIPMVFRGIWQPSATELVNQVTGQGSAV